MTVISEKTLKNKTPNDLDNHWGAHLLAGQPWYDQRRNTTLMTIFNPTLTNPQTDEDQKKNKKKKDHYTKEHYITCYTT
jgi:hypothetical protein